MKISEEFKEKYSQLVMVWIGIFAGALIGGPLFSIYLHETSLIASDYMKFFGTILGFGFTAAIVIWQMDKSRDMEQEKRHAKAVKEIAAHIAFIDNISVAFNNAQNTNNKDALTKIVSDIDKFETGQSNVNIGIYNYQMLTDLRSLYNHIQNFLLNKKISELEMEAHKKYESIMANARNAGLYNVPYVSPINHFYQTAKKQHFSYAHNLKNDD